MVKKILLAVVLIVAILWFVGCQTIQGLGRDITWTGEAAAGALEGK